MTVSKRQFDITPITLTIEQFKGVKKIVDLNVYPIEYHPDPDMVRGKLTARGRRWMGFTGIHHMHYNGMAYRHGNKMKVGIIST